MHVGISGDATIISIFTSNYDLESSCLESLQRLDMFKNLTVVNVAPVSGKDRESFALSYLTRCVEESVAPWKGMIDINLDIPYGTGDTRPLVRYLKMLSFYIHSLISTSKAITDDNASSIHVLVSYDASSQLTSVQSGKQLLQLKSGSFQNLYAVNPSALDSRASGTVLELQKLHPHLKNPEELLQILDFYFASLAPWVAAREYKRILVHLDDWAKEACLSLVKVLSKLAMNVTIPYRIIPLHYSNTSMHTFSILRRAFLGVYQQFGCYVGGSRHVAYARVQYIQL